MPLMFLGFAPHPHETEDPLETRSVSRCLLRSPCSQEALTGQTRSAPDSIAGIKAPEVDRKPKAPGCVPCYPRGPGNLGLAGGAQACERLGAKRGVHMVQSGEGPGTGLPEPDCCRPCQGRQPSSPRLPTDRCLRYETGVGSRRGGTGEAMRSPTLK